MKNIIIILSLTISTFVNASQIKTIYQFGNEDKQYAFKGFDRDGFQAPEDYTSCFTGNINSICEQVYLGGFNSSAEYSNGGHEIMYVNSCEIIDSKIKANITLDNDYDGEVFQGNILISPCSSEMLQVKFPSRDYDNRCY